ncbi:MAG: glutamate synthase large subunit [Thermoanaerobaculia bacterium]
MCGVGFIADLHGNTRRSLLPLALTALSRLAHRGALDADGRTGDGAGVMTEIPRSIFGVDDIAVGSLFLPRQREAAACARRILTTSLASHGLALTDWREVPVDDNALGEKAKSCRPDIFQVIVTRNSDMNAGEFERRLVAARKETEQRATASHLDDFYIASLSHRTLVYKALVRAVDLAAFYTDLRNPEFETSFVLFHQRFSTNTLPSWAMTQPFRLLAHNGEINTISGNRSWMRAAGTPVAEGTSDSASLDEAFSLQPCSAAACRRLLDTWEGPALVAFSDGRTVGAALDHNGLRPARYVVTNNGLVLVASEAGVLDVDEAEILHRGRIGPGGMLAVDLERGELIDSEEPSPGLRPPSPASGRGHSAGPKPSIETLRAFSYTHDELQMILGPMFEKGMEPLGSMGDDTPLAVLSARPRLLFSYFKQRFAQVTNPPIDPLRESLVMSLGEPLLDSEDVSGEPLSLLFESPLDEALDRLLANAAIAARNGAACLVLSDRGVDSSHAAIPSLLAVSAVHQHLVREGLRLDTSIVADTGEARDDHQIAALLGFGADAVCPWLALDLAGENRDRYRDAITKGLLKIMSKMGVSTMRSYRGAQLFEALGISGDVIERHFTGTPSPIGGIGLDDIEREVLQRHHDAYRSGTTALQDEGFFRYRQRGEAHAFEPRVIKALHKAIESGTPMDYKTYAGLVHARDPLTLRDLLEFRSGGSIPLQEVEPAGAIVRRFMTAAMSLGALSSEAQQVLAAAMNRMDARSNSGEGGEPPEVYGTVTSHRIKQVASGRFGVTAEYLMGADEIQIKIAQGSKPGEGGQLPGHKVTPFIARVRHAQPGQTLISPPPHHDIYSIEDLAQLVYDLKRVNPSATVSVKLVSSAGIGTIAVGVAKAHADAIEISGHDGGTGASPLGSIKNAGTPWELGLSEVQQALTLAGLRGRVRLQVNGGLKTGRDVVMAAILGAEEFGFGTAALVAVGCVMARQCHLNTCPAGIATQREDLRAKFNGTADDVVRFFTAVAEEVRGILSMLGARGLDDVVGRTELLEQRIPTTGKASKLRLDPLLVAFGGPRRCMQTRNDPPETGSRIDEQVLGRLRFTGPPVEMSFAITNADRSVGARIAGEMSRQHADVTLTFRGSAGQSFGAFAVDGMRLILDGEANDYVGKGMSGGEIIVRNKDTRHVIAGTTLLYGATGGRAFIAGRTGERFAVRNSGAFAVVEGTGDHACEYMTAGAVVILGPTGRNAGAGMSGGALFVFDPDAQLANRINTEYVGIDAELTDEAWLYDAIALHAEMTGSSHAAALLLNWSETCRNFRRVSPCVRPAVEQLPEIAERQIGRAIARRRSR